MLGKGCAMPDPFMVRMLTVRSTGLRVCVLQDYMAWMATWGNHEESEEKASSTWTRGLL